MLLLDDFLVELLVCADVGSELLLVNGASVLLKRSDEAAVVVKHLAVEAEQVVVLVSGVVQPAAERVDFNGLCLLLPVGLLDEALEGEVVLQEGVDQEGVRLRPLPEVTVLLLHVLLDQDEPAA
jgi:hypothetical protein